MPAGPQDPAGAGPEKLWEAKLKKKFEHFIHHGDTEYTEMHGEPWCLCEISVYSVSPW